MKPDKSREPSCTGGHDAIRQRINEPKNCPICGWVIYPSWGYDIPDEQVKIEDAVKEEVRLLESFIEALTLNILHGDTKGYAVALTLARNALIEGLSRAK